MGFEDEVAERGPECCVVEDRRGEGGHFGLDVEAETGRLYGQLGVEKRLLDRDGNLGFEIGANLWIVDDRIDGVRERLGVVDEHPG